MITNKKLNSVSLVPAVLILFLIFLSSTASAATTTSSVVGIDYQYEDWGQYPVIDLFGEKYVPLLEENNQIWKSHVDRLAKLVIDNGDSYSFTTGESFDLGQGYSLQIKQIDVDGEKVWLEFDKNGQYVDDQIISTGSGADTWNCALDNIQGINNVVVLKVHVKQIFQGATDGIVQIDGIWLIDYANSRKLQTWDKFGDYTLIKITNGADASNLGSLVFESGNDSAIYAYITNSGDDTVSVIDTATNTVTATVNSVDSPYGVAAIPDGTKVYVTKTDAYSASENGTIYVIDTATNTVAATVTVGHYPFGIAVNPAGTKVYVANHDSNTVSVIDTATDTVTATVDVGNVPWGIAVNPTGTKVYVVNSYIDNSVSIIDTATNTVEETVPVGNNPIGVVVNPAGTEVYVTNNGDKTVSVIDTRSNTVTSTVDVGERPFGIAINPKGTRVYVANAGPYFTSEDGTVSVIDTETNTVTATVSVGNSPYGIAVTPDGSYVYVANTNDDTVSVIDTYTNDVISTLNVGRYPDAFGQFIGSIPSPKPVLPIASFSAYPLFGVKPHQVSFKDKSTGLPTSWCWDFGDGNTSIEKNPVHTYYKAGRYSPSLTVGNDIGSDTRTRYNYIVVM